MFSRSSGIYSGACSTIDRIYFENLYLIEGYNQSIVAIIAVPGKNFKHIKI